MTKPHKNPLKLSHWPNIGPDFMGDAVQEALEQWDSAREEIARLQEQLTRLRLDAARWRWFQRNMQKAATIPMRLMPPDVVVLKEVE